MSEELEKIKEDIADLNENKVQRTEQLKVINEKLDRIFTKMDNTNKRLQALEDCFSTSKATIKAVAYIGAFGLAVSGFFANVFGVWPFVK